MNELVVAFLTAVDLIITLDPAVMEIAGRSIMISSSATICASFIGIPLGAVITFGTFPGRGTLINLIQTLYALPTVLVGLLVFILFSNAGPLGFLDLLFTAPLMVVGETMLILPIITGLTISALSGLPRVVSDSIRSLGATKLQFLWTAIHEVRFALIAGVIMGFGRAISEVGAAIMIGGNIRGYTRVLTTAISLETSMGNIEFSMALGIILLLIALVVNLGMTIFQQRGVA